MSRRFPAPLYLAAGLSGAAGIVIAGLAAMTPMIRTASVSSTGSASSASCSTLTAAAGPGSNYTFTVTASGNSASVAGYTFNFGDHQAYTVTFTRQATQNPLTATINHTYKSAGSYIATARIDPKAGSKKVAVASLQCQTSFAVGLPGSSLPNTGSSQGPLVFVAATLAGMAVYQLRLRHHRTSTRKSPPAVIQ